MLARIATTTRLSLVQGGGALSRAGTRTATAHPPTHPPRRAAWRRRTAHPQPRRRGCRRGCSRGSGTPIKHDRFEARSGSSHRRVMVFGFLFFLMTRFETGTSSLKQCRDRFRRNQVVAMKPNDFFFKCKILLTITAPLPLSSVDLIRKAKKGKSGREVRR